MSINLNSSSLHFSHKLILGSASPRRQELLSGLGFVFSVEPTNTDEGFSSGLSAEKIPLYLAEKKSEAFYREIEENELLITADTIVWHNNTVLNKPLQYSDALHMLQTLSGGMHEVFTGVCLRARHKTELFFDVTKVYFKKLSFEEIDYYIKNYNVYDKAGAYGAQDWIGFVAIEKIEGSYFNVMGLPTQMLYNKLINF
jgi:septum formation protein